MPCKGVALCMTVAGSDTLTIWLKITFLSQKSCNNGEMVSGNYYVIITYYYILTAEQSMHDAWVYRQ